MVAHMAGLGAERLWARVRYLGEPLPDSPRVADPADALRHFTRAAGFTLCVTDPLDLGFGAVSYDLYQWKKPCLQQ
jgi:hypothetical protein